MNPFILFQMLIRFFTARTQIRLEELELPSVPPAIYTKRRNRARASPQVRHYPPPERYQAPAAPAMPISRPRVSDVGDHSPEPEPLTSKQMQDLFKKIPSRMPEVEELAPLKGVTKHEF
jgi:hypothetical protein